MAIFQMSSPSNRRSRAIYRIYCVNKLFFLPADGECREFSFRLPFVICDAYENTCDMHMEIGRKMDTNYFWRNERYGTDTDNESSLTVNTNHSCLTEKSSLLDWKLRRDIPKGDGTADSNLQMCEKHRKLRYIISYYREDTIGCKYIKWLLVKWPFCPANRYIFKYISRQYPNITRRGEITRIFFCH